MIIRSHHKASALIFTLLIMALIASAALYVARSASRESRIVTANDATVGAYYAAEAGIEDGLARLAADRNIEVPTCKYATSHGSDATLPCDATDGANFNTELSLDNLGVTKSSDPNYAFPSRIRIARSGSKNGSDSTSNCNNATTAPTLFSECTGKLDGDLNTAVDPTSVDPTADPHAFLYDLKITSRVSKIGNVDGTGRAIDSHTSTDPQAVFKSNTVKDIQVDTLAPNAPTKLDVYWTCDSGCSASDFLFVTLTRTDGTTFDKVLTNFEAGTRYTVPGLNSAVTPVNKVRLQLNAVDSHIGVSLYDEPNNKTVLFKGTKITVQSVGYYAGTSRRLEASVDKSSGALLGLFDYAVYAGSSFIQPN